MALSAFRSGNTAASLKQMVWVPGGCLSGAFRSGNTAASLKQSKRVSAYLTGMAFPQWKHCGLIEALD